MEILIVEDSPTQAEQLKYILDQHGYSVTVAGNGMEALDILRKKKPAIVVSDILMPEMDGYQLCRQIKADDDLKDIPVILVTTLSDPQDVIRGLECGADNFIVKPYDEEYLLNRVRYILTNRELRKVNRTQMGVEILFSGQKYFITSERQQILDLLLSTYETAVQKNLELVKAQEELRALNEQLEEMVEDRTAALRAEMAEHRRAEEKIREQASLLDNAREAMIAHDLEAGITYWNKGAERLYGWTAEETLGKKVNELLYRKVPEDLEEVRRILFQTGVWQGERNQVTRDGQDIIVDCHLTLVRDERGQPKAVFILFTDITEKKKLEAQFLRAQRMESIGTLAGGIAHDLNNVLAPILGAVQILRSRAAEDRDRKLLDVLEASAQRGAEMVKQVLSFARGAEGERIILQLRHLIRELERILKETFPRSIQIRTNLPRDLNPILGDSTQLHQVLMNLCVNARDAMPAGGLLLMEAENVNLDDHYALMNPQAKPGPHVVLSVSDTGTGMPPGVVDKIFEPFFSTKEVGKGTGLGLSTVMGIVKGHGGFITVYSEVGKGARFKIYLPAGETAETRRAEVEQPELPAGNGELVLVVDDELSIQEVTRLALETYGYRVLTAGDGTEALALYAQHRGEVAVVVTDMMMPFMDGPATIRALQKLDPGVKIIAISGMMANKNVAHLAESDPVAFLPKPHTTEQLLRTLHEVLAGKPGAADSV